MLQNTYLVVIDVDIGKDILGDGIQNLASLKEVIDTRRALTPDNIFLIVRSAAIDSLRYRLINAERQYQLTR